uniref:Uncharacterized protein n=1 Tax=Mandrillus leucophaeus TaxID=9568 RepID=A0A2K5XPZ2_MANLE
MSAVHVNENPCCLIECHPLSTFALYEHFSFHDLVSFPYIMRSDYICANIQI